MENNTKFWVFGGLQAISLGLIIFFVLQSVTTLGQDTQIWLSCMFPAFLLAVEHMIYSK
ncbi:MAG: hypothetical protein GOU99_03875 [Candidatus Altiarchaeota archaeon]|nr:hypothetical protein [Candidatus Altiarchaeota archaeon]